MNEKAMTVKERVSKMMPDKFEIESWECKSMDSLIALKDKYEERLSLVRGRAVGMLRYTMEEIEKVEKRLAEIDGEHVDYDMACERQKLESYLSSLKNNSAGKIADEFLHDYQCICHELSMEEPGAFLRSEAKKEIQHIKQVAIMAYWRETGGTMELKEIERLIDIGHPTFKPLLDIVKRYSLSKDILPRCDAGMKLRIARAVESGNIHNVLKAIAERMRD